MPSPAEPPGRRALPDDLGRLLHDLRGPLNSAVMHLEVLKRAVAADPMAEDSLRTVQQQLARLAEMLPAAFDIAALEIRELRRLDLRAVVEGALAGMTGVRLEPGAWPAVRGDESLLSLAVTQLVRNALDVTPAGAPAPLVTATAEEDGRIVLTVRDWGPGLRSSNPKLLIRLFASDKRDHGSRGVGLPIADRIARLHGGSLRFSSPPPPGALVSLVLPTPD